MLILSLLATVVAKLAVGFVVAISATVIADVGGGPGVNPENGIIMACATLAGKIVRAYVWR
jgi:hypothetical protein